VIWRADDRFTRLEGEACEAHAAALAAVAGASLTCRGLAASTKG
jgi:hypothetical protein